MEIRLCRRRHNQKLRRQRSEGPRCQRFHPPRPSPAQRPGRRMCPPPRMRTCLLDRALPRLGPRRAALRTLMVERPGATAAVRAVQGVPAAQSVRRMPLLLPPHRGMLPRDITKRWRHSDGQKGPWRGTTRFFRMNCGRQNSGQATRRSFPRIRRRRLCRR